jgi:hypothetical protein
MQWTIVTLPRLRILTGNRVGFRGLAALELRALRAHRQSARSLSGKRGIESRSRQPLPPQASEPQNTAHRVRLGRPVIHVRRARSFIPKLAKTPPTPALTVLDGLRPRQPRSCGRKEWANWPRWATWTRSPEQREHHKPRHDSREDDHGHLPARWPQAARHFAHNTRAFPVRGHRQTTVPRAVLVLPAPKRGECRVSRRPVSPLRPRGRGGVARVVQAAGTADRAAEGVGVNVRSSAGGARWALEGDRGPQHPRQHSYDTHGSTDRRFRSSGHRLPIGSSSRENVASVRSDARPPPTGARSDARVVALMVRAMDHTSTAFHDVYGAGNRLKTLIRLRCARWRTTQTSTTFVCSCGFAAPTEGR